jgi:release factor glutamine methyltransferase
VPRPETEQLAEFGWKFLEDCGETPKALDFGTGTGCIAIALAVKCPRAEIWGLDTSSSALALAKRNADRHQVGEKVHFLEASTLDLADPGLRFDLVISNPPYINSSEIGQLQPEVKDFDPLLALDGGADGLDYYRLLATQAGQVLACGGRFMAEFGDGQAEAIRAIFQSQNWIVENIVEDYTRRQRFLIARRE